MRDDPSPERARALHEAEVERCRRMAAHAVELFAPGARVLTHCNAGGLATGGYGTAVGAIRRAWEEGLVAHVWVDETRPLLQGSRLTAWELEGLGVPFSVLPTRPPRRAWPQARSTASSPAPTGSRRTGTRPTRSGRTPLAVLARHHGSRSTWWRRPPPSTSPRRPVPGSRSRSATRPRSRTASRPATRRSTSRRRN